MRFRPEFKELAGRCRLLGRCFYSDQPKRSLLKLSNEARRQLNAGSALSDEPARPVPILEEIFEDSALYQANYGIPDAKNVFPTPNSPMVSESFQLRGLKSPFVDQMFSKNLLSTSALRRKYPHYTLAYFPPWHILAAGRTTRPGFVVFTTKGEQFNGNPERAAYQKQIKSRNPFDYAFWRLKTKRLFKTAFMNVWTDHTSPRDGLYIVTTTQVPRNSKQLQQELFQYVDLVSKTQDFKWVAKHNQRIDVGYLKKGLRFMRLPLPKFLPESAWTKQKN